MIHFTILRASLKQSFKAAADRCHLNKLPLIRALLIALLVAAPFVAPRHQQAQDDCMPTQTEGCYTQAKRDIAFLIDASGSVEQRGQALCQCPESRFALFGIY